MVSSAEEQSKRYPKNLFVHRGHFQEVLHGYGTKLWVFCQPEELSERLRLVGWRRRAKSGSLYRRLQLDRYDIGCGDCHREFAAALEQPGGPVRVQPAGQAISAGIRERKNRGQERSLRSHHLSRQAGCWAARGWHP